MQAAARESRKLHAEIPIMATLNGQSRLVHVPSIIRSWVVSILRSRYEYRYKCTI